MTAGTINNKAQATSRWAGLLGPALLLTGGLAALVVARRAEVPSAAIRLALSLAGGLLLAWPQRPSTIVDSDTPEPADRPPDQPAAVRRPAGGRAAAIVALAVVATLHSSGVDLWHWLTTPQVRVWNVFHYYLGAEYFDELGYDDLYVAALAADAEGPNTWRRIERVRNLATLAVEPRVLGELRYDPTAHFTAARWVSFRGDVVALQVHREPRQWTDIFRDRGYNPSPFWTVLASQLTTKLPATSLAALKTLTALDLVLLVATFVLLGRSFGLAAAATVWLLFVLTPVNAGRLIGGFLQYDWFCAVAAGLAMVARRQAVWAATFLGYAALARVFPLAIAGAVVLPELARAVTGWLRERRLAVDPFVRRYALALAAVGVIGLLVGSTTSRGPAAWLDFAERIERHSSAHVFGEQRVGLKHLFTSALPGSELLDEAAAVADRAPSRDDRRATFARQRGLYLGLALTLIALFGVTVWRREPVAAALLGLVVIFALAVASRYYWALLTLLPLAATLGAGVRSRFLLLAAGQAIIYAAFSVVDLSDGSRYDAYVLFNGLLAALFVAWLVMLARLDWRERQEPLRATAPATANVSPT